LSRVGIESPERDYIVQFLRKIKGNDNTVSELIFSLQTLDLRAESFLDSDAVRIMTIHKAKGLSSELVIIPALEDEVMPGKYEENARRLLYVAMTRSRNYLVMTHALLRSGPQSYLGQGIGRPTRRASRFLTEIGIGSKRGDTFVPNPQAPRVIVQDLPPINRQVDTGILRELLNAAFSDQEIRDLAFDRFRAVYDQFGSDMGKDRKISELIEFCMRRCALDDLISEVKMRNIIQFQKYENRLYS
jgi:hypothetical protein